MPFNKQLKHTVKKKANFTCCWCGERSLVDIHHIIPQSQGGPDTEDNAAPLCGSCHDLYGNNPDLRKEIRSRPDHLYESCSSANPSHPPVSTPQQNTYSEEDILDLIPQRSITDILDDQQRERGAERFSLVQNDHTIHEYTLQDVDKLTTTQRERLFAADPEMLAWWRGKSLINNAQPLFRVRGGIWITKDQIEQMPQEGQHALWERIPDLLEWYVQDLVF